jgi:hypothetical protein
MNAPAIVGRPSWGFLSLKQFPNRTPLDFCDKYQVTGEKPERVRLFMAKLGGKNQAEEQRSI